MNYITWIDDGRVHFFREKDSLACGRRALAVFAVMGYNLLWLVKLTAPTAVNSAINGLDSMPYFSLHPHANTILAGLALCAAMLPPLCFCLGLRSYRGTPPRRV